MKEGINKNQMEYINRLKKHLSAKDKEYLFDLCFSFGYQSVIYEATYHKNSPTVLDFCFANTDKEIEKIKSKCNNKRFSAMVLYSIWIIYYSGLLMQLDYIEKEDNGSIVKMFALGETFFNVKTIPVFYWPFEGSNPFINRREADEFQAIKMPKILDGEL